MRMSGVLVPSSLAAAVAGCLLLGTGGQAFAQTEISMSCAPFGSIMYAVGNAMQDLAQKEKADFRIVNAEGPGSTAVTVNMLRDESWQKRIGCTSQLDFVYANRGVQPFFSEPDPNLGDDIKILFNGFYGAVGILTTDPSIKSAAMLDGKTLGMGKRSQAHWAGLPLLFFETGLPDADIDMQFLGPPASHDALVEGRVDAVISQLTVRPDGSEAFAPGVVTKLFASGKDIYLVGFDEKTFERAAAEGVKFSPIRIGPDVVPETASKEPVNFVLAPAAISVHRNFPEDLAYEVTKFMIEHAGSLPQYHAMLETISTPEALLGDWTAEDLHPGARRAFEEAGLL